MTKRIPWAAGLGGGSSDAAATLAGLNELWELGLSTDRLSSMGAELGSDVPFFFHPPAAFMHGPRRSGASRRRSAGPSISCWSNLLQGISTAKVYQECCEDCPHSGEASGSPQSALEALAEGDIEKLARSLHNRLQEPAMRICPPVERLYRRMQNAGRGRMFDDRFGILLVCPMPRRTGGQASRP